VCRSHTDPIGPAIDAIVRGMSDLRAHAEWMLVNGDEEIGYQQKQARIETWIDDPAHFSLASAEETRLGPSPAP
jgi:hypothetical protein